MLQILKGRKQYIEKTSPDEYFHDENPRIIPFKFQNSIQPYSLQIMRYEKLKFNLDENTRAYHDQREKEIARIIVEDLEPTFTECYSKYSQTEIQQIDDLDAISKKR